MAASGIPVLTGRLQAATVCCAFHSDHVWWSNRNGSKSPCIQDDLRPKKEARQIRESSPFSVLRKPVNSEYLASCVVQELSKMVRGWTVFLSFSAA